MYLHKRHRITLIAALAVILFFSGRFYKEIDAFFITPASLIGLLFAIIGLLAFVILGQKLKISKMRLEKSEAYHSCEEYRQDLNRLNSKIRETEDKNLLLKDKIEAEKTLSATFLSLIQKSTATNAGRISQLKETHAAEMKTLTDKLVAQSEEIGKQKGIIETLKPSK